MGSIRILLDTKKVNPTDASKMLEELKQYGTLNENEFSYEEENGDKIIEVLEKYFSSHNDNPNKHNQK